MPKRRWPSFGPVLTCEANAEAKESSSVFSFARVAPPEKLRRLLAVELTCRKNCQLRRAAQVFGPTIPSGLNGLPSKSKLSVWNALTAFSVRDPKSPSMGPGS
jgi:hypothetical protein